LPDSLLLTTILIPYFKIKISCKNKKKCIGKCIKETNKIRIEKNKKDKNKNKTDNNNKKSNAISDKWVSGILAICYCFTFENINNHPSGFSS